MNASLIAILLILSSSFAQAKSFNRLIFEPGKNETHLISQLYFLDNREDALSLDQIREGRGDERFQESKKWNLALDLGGTQQPVEFWLRFEIDNQKNEDIILASDHSTTPHLSRIYMFREHALQPYRIVDVDPSLPRTRRFFSIPPGPSLIIVAVHRDNRTPPLMNFDVKSLEFHSRRSYQVHFLSLSYGICLALIAYNIVLALTVRNRAHFIYIAYSFAVLLYYEGRYQFLGEYFGVPALPEWSILPINASGTFLFLVFLYEMLGISKNLPAWKIPVWMLIAMWPILILYSFIDHWTTYRVLLAILILALPVTLCIGVHSIVRRIPGAPLLFASSLLPGMGSFVHLQPDLFSKWLSMPFIQISQLLALDVEMILLSMTIGFKINREQAWMRSKIDHAYTELKSMVYPHQLEQIWQGKPLDQTMPVGLHFAYVIDFDVIASSKMHLDDPRSFLAKVFRECSALMMEKYQPEGLIANAYRIKELGDGFLCSVGFPFACPSRNAADHSVKLAQDFIKIFDRHVAASGSDAPIHCAIGIAFGPVEAFYPENGAQIYDMFGRGIILAHRYQSMRDPIFQWLQQRESILILHPPVFEKLSKDLKADFTEVDLLLRQMRVRDDEKTPKLYYQLSESTAKGRNSRQTA